MLGLKVYFENGDHLVTSINATLEEAKAYYLGNVFNIGTVEDNLQECVKVETV